MITGGYCQGQTMNKIKDRIKKFGDAVNGSSVQVKNDKVNINLNFQNKGNIKYKENPDIRTRDEIKIDKKQKLVIENGEIENFIWQPIADFENHVFPSFIIAWASYEGDKEKDMGSSLGFQIQGTMPGTVFKWEIECTDKKYFNIDSGFIRYQYANSTLNFKPKIGWDFRYLTKHQTSAPVGIYFRLIDPLTGKKSERLVNINLRSINDCMYYYDQASYRYLYTAYINEDHPEIDNILKEALDTKMTDAFSGYQEGRRKVDLQIAAIWRVLHDRGFKYSSITNNSGKGSNNVYAQTVRTFDNAIKTNQANCVDGTVVMASILKRIGISTFMVLVPGHCFLGYYVDDPTNPQSSKEINYVETTAMSSTTYLTLSKSSLAKYNNTIQESLPRGATLSDKNKAYYLQFLQAKKSGQRSYDEALEKDGINSITMLNVNEQRKYVKPIPVYYD